MLALTAPHEVQPVKAPIQIEELQPKEIKRPDFDIEVLTPLRAAQAAKQAELDKLAAEEQERLRQAEVARQTVYTPQQSTWVTPSVYTGDLIAGRAGFIAPGNNCVDWVKQFRSVPMGNPIGWQPTTMKPFIGAIAVFYFNHTARVEGIYSDGSVAVSHANAPGAPVRYTMRQIRGFL